MKKKDVTLDEAIELLRAEYEKALRTKYVVNPLAWALYHTWEKVHKSTGEMSKEKQLFEDLVEIFEEEYEKRRLITPQNTAEKMTAKGYSKQSEWISVEERLPTAEENDRGLVGIVNGHNGKIGFIDAIIFVDYDFEEREWWSTNYDITNCRVKYWMLLPEPPKMKGGAE